jgi:UDP-N-acetylglucosamine 2-epimerase
VLARLDLQPGTYALVTAHRAGNTDDPVRLQQIVTALNSVSETVVFPAHPRTRRAFAQLGACFAAHVKLIEPVSYFDMMVLEENARLIATDSGGVQREAYFLGIPCLTLREGTEWTETVTAGWNRLVGTDVERVLDAWLNFTPPAERPPIFGDGTAAQRIGQILDGGAVTFGLPRSQLVEANSECLMSLEMGVNL